MRFLVFLHTSIIFCWLPSHRGISGNERANSEAKAALTNYVSECLISYTDAYQYLSQYVRDLWQCEWGTAVKHTSFMLHILDRRTAVRLQIRTLRRSCFI